MVIYLSGPISLDRETAPQRFSMAARLLSNQGHSVINPVDIGCALEKLMGRQPSEREYLRADFHYLLTCDAVALLPGWINSDGAQKEKALAEWAGIKVAEVKDFII